MAVQSIVTGSSGPFALRASGSSLATALERWLEARQPGAAVAEAAMSADHTVLVDAGWAGEPHRLVVRLGPTGQFDARLQFLTLQRLAAQLARPAVPSALWCEDDADLLGAPFFVMTYVDGLTTAKYQTPYTFASWITEATAAERERMQVAMLQQLARVHAATPADFAFLDRRRPGESVLAAHVRRTAERYDAVSAAGLRAPRIERAFTWLREHWPSESTPVLCWGDARIDNAIYRDFSTVTLTGWRHATLAPRELDLGAMILNHRFADDLAHAAGKPGLPDFLHPADVVATYADISGYQPADLDFYIAYAALIHAIEKLRSPLRTSAFKTLDDAMGDER